MTTDNANVPPATVYSSEIEKTVWYRLSLPELFERLRSTPEGLSEGEAKERLAEFGPNALPSPPRPGLLIIFLHQFLSPLIYILITAGIVSLVIEEMTDAAFIFAVILLNATLGTAQEWKAEKSASALRGLLKIQSLVLRGGEKRRISAEEIVAGDIVLLESGNRVPADMRLLRARNLQVDESLLTGESAAVFKESGLLDGEIPLAERRNMAFAGSTVASGRATGLVVATALATEVGRIARSVTETGVVKPPLLIRMERFARQVSFLVLGFVVILAIVSHLRGIPWTEVFFMSVALAVSAIPEGLPVAMTVALSIATTRMARRNVIVRRLTAVEGLGSCTCIASDKTGTLTVNRQTVKAASLPDGTLYRITGEGYSGEGSVTDAQGASLDEEARQRLVRLGTAAVICNEATLEKEGDRWMFDGDAVDVALLSLGYKLGFEPANISLSCETLGEIPFESERRFAARFYRDGGKDGVAVKGAVEALIPFCSFQQGVQGEEPFDTEAVRGSAEALAAGGYRVIAVCDGLLSAPLRLDSPTEETLPPLTFLGLIALIDPLRPEVKGAVERCRRAGVKVVMVTGDHPATALNIAMELGIATGRDDLVTGHDLEEAGPGETPLFLETVRRGTVFSRVTPLQKLEIVDALNRLGHFVAVTGDGVNDAPALRRASIGVAMGSGTDVAKDTASIIIADDNFVSIEGGVEEGRFAYDNVRKVTYLLISTGAAEIVLFTLALATGLPLPLLAVQLLWLNLVTNGIQDVALAFEGGEPGAMNRPPRPPTQGIFDRLMTLQTIVSGLIMGTIAFALWWWINGHGWEVERARNYLLLLMVLLENIHVFNCRSERISAFRVPLRRNLLLVVGVAVAQGVHILAMQSPFMQTVLHIAPVSLAEWFVLILFASSLLFAMELFKSFEEKRRKG